LEYDDRAENIRVFMHDNFKNLREELNTIDWLHIYGNAIKEHSMDIQAVFRHSVTGAKYLESNILKDMQNSFGGSKNLSWDDLATYAIYLKEHYA